MTTDDIQPAKPNETAGERLQELVTYQQTLHALLEQGEQLTEAEKELATTNPLDYLQQERGKL
jgi:hypothetical protein